jgi:hypothetical protein
MILCRPALAGLSGSTLGDVETPAWSGAVSLSLIGSLLVKVETPAWSGAGLLSLVGRLLVEAVGPVKGDLS